MARLRPFLLPGLFFLLMLAAAVLLWSVALPDLLFQIRIDLGNIVFLIGLAGAAGWISARLWLRWRLRRTVEIVQAQSADERRRFLRRLNHELKNPLTAIRAGLANLASAPNQDLRSEVITSIDAQTLRLSRLASDLRKLAELEIRPLELTQVDSASLLQEAFDLAESQPGAAGRSLRLTLPQAPWPLPHIQGDRDLLFLAVHNLLDNALKFSGAGNTSKCAPSKTGLQLWSRWPTPGRASLPKRSTRSGRNCIAARERVRSRAAGWDCRWCARSSPATADRWDCAAAQGRGRWLP